jgi:hypothetical protein
MAEVADQEFIGFYITADAKGAINWTVDYANTGDPANASDRGQTGGIQLHRRRQPMGIENTTSLPDFERRWRTLSLLAEEWAWLNGSGKCSFSPPGVAHRPSSGC